MRLAPRTLLNVRLDAEPELQGMTISPPATSLRVYDSMIEGAVTVLLGQPVAYPVGLRLSRAQVEELHSALGAYLEATP